MRTYTYKNTSIIIYTYTLPIVYAKIKGHHAQLIKLYY